LYPLFSLTHIIAYVIYNDNDLNLFIENNIGSFLSYDYEPKEKSTMSNMFVGLKSYFYTEDKSLFRNKNSLQKELKTIINDLKQERQLGIDDKYKICVDINQRLENLYSAQKGITDPDGFYGYLSFDGGLHSLLEIIFGGFFGFAVNKLVDTEYLSSNFEIVYEFTMFAAYHIVAQYAFSGLCSETDKRIVKNLATKSEKVSLIFSDFKNRYSDNIPVTPAHSSDYLKL